MEEEIVLQKYADQFAAMGSGPRLRIVRLLLSCFPSGLIVGEIQGELGIANSTLSHHLEKLKHEGLVTTVREGTALRYTANVRAFKELLSYFLAECCTRDPASEPSSSNSDPCC